MNEINHGMPRHDYFAIFQPTFQRGGLECSGIGIGIGQQHKLINPHNKTEVVATLICRRTIYTSSPEFEALCYVLYGNDKETLMEKFRKLNEGMIEELMEMWTFKKT